MAIAILDQAVFSGTPDGTLFTFSFNAVPVGTTRLLVLVENRGQSSGSAPVVTSVTHNGDTVTSGIVSTAPGYNEINTWWGDRLNPDTGIHDVVVTFPTTARGCKCWVLAISGELASGTIFGARALQRTVPANTDTIGLGLTPITTGDSLILASLGISVNTTLTSFTGTGFTLVETGNYSPLGTLTSTSRYRNGTSGAVTVSAVFGTSNSDLGGSLVEILAEPTASNVSGSFTTTLGVTGSVAAGLATARLEDGSFLNGLSNWSMFWIVQPDAAAVDRRLLSAGPSGSPNLTIDQVAVGNATSSVWRMRYRNTDGQVIVETGPGTQSTSPTTLGFIVNPGYPDFYISGLPSESYSSGDSSIGSLDIGSGGLSIGGHDSASPAPYTGLIGRCLIRRDSLTAAQMRLMGRAEEDPDSLWAYGEEDAADDPNLSPLAYPMDETLTGEAVKTLRPKITDPRSGELAIAAVTQPSNGTLSIGTDNTLIYRPNAGWQGIDLATYTVSDGLGKTSVGKIILRQNVAALIANGDAVGVTAGSSVSFNPRANDTGSGPLVITAISTPAHGTAVIQSNGNVLYTPTALYSGADSFTYTIHDNFNTASATVTVTVHPTSTQFVTASDDTIITAQGVAVLVSPLGNDTFATGLGPLIIAPGSVTPPSPSGTAAIQANQRDILFTPASGFVGAASFSYTASSTVNALLQDTALITAQVQSTTPIGQEWPALASGNTLRTATSNAEFTAHYAASAPGDHVVVANGVTLTSPTLNRQGVVVRALHNQGATISGTLTMSASNQWIWGFYGVRFRILAGTNGLTFRRMHFDNNGAAGGYVSGEMEQTADTKFLYCTFSNSQGGLRWNNKCRRGTMRFCHWFNITGQVNATESLLVLEGIDQTYTIGGFLFEDLLFEFCNLGGQENETISNKCSGSIYRRVQFDRCRDFNLRFGNDNQVLGCIVPSSGSGELSARGMNHIFNNCEGTISLDSGNYLADQGDASHEPTGDTATKGTGKADFANCMNVTIIGGSNAFGSQIGGDALIKLGPDAQHTVKVTGTRIEGRGSSPNLSIGQADAPTIVATTAVPLVARPNFPIGQHANNAQVGVRGGL